MAPSIEVSNVLVMLITSVTIRPISTDARNFHFSVIQSSLGMSVDSIEYQNLHMLMHAICYYYHTILISYYGPQGHPYDCFPMGSMYMFI